MAFFQRSHWEWIYEPRSKWAGLKSWKWWWSPPQKKNWSLPSASQVVIVADGANGAVLCRNRSGDFWILTVPMISYDHFLSLLTLLLDHYASSRMWLLASSLRHLLGRTRAPSSRHDGWAVRMGMGSLVWILNPVSQGSPSIVLSSMANLIVFHVGVLYSWPGKRHGGHTEWHHVWVCLLVCVVMTGFFDVFSLG